MVKNLAKEILGRFGFLTGPLARSILLRPFFQPIHQKLQCSRRILHYTLNFVVGITTRCQCSCVHCGVASHKREAGSELTLEEIKKAIEGAIQIGAGSCLFFGGEPLLRPDLCEMVTYAANLGLQTRVDTNGILLDRKMARMLKRSGLHWVHVSIDSPCAEIHDRLRGVKGCFEKAVQGIRSSREAGLFVQVSTYIHHNPLSNGDAKKVVELGQKMGVNKIRVLPYIQCGDFAKKDLCCLSEEDSALLRELEKNPLVFTHGVKNCDVSKKEIVYVSPYGFVQPCMFVPLSFGNVRKEPLETIVARMFQSPLYEIPPVQCIMNHKDFQEKYLSRLPQDGPLPASPEELKPSA